MNDLYDDLWQVKADIESGSTIVETIICNEKNERVVRYLQGALAEMRRALSYMSDAEFEITTSPIDD
jgi:hypothetical protein